MEFGSLFHLYNGLKSDDLGRLTDDSWLKLNGINNYAEHVMRLEGSEKGHAKKNRKEFSSSRHKSSS